MSAPQGTICWTIQIIPQIWKSYRTKDTTGLSDWMILSWAIAGAFLGAYAVIQNINIPLILQPQMFSALGTISWAQVRLFYIFHTFSLDQQFSSVCIMVENSLYFSPLWLA